VRSWVSLQSEADGDGVKRGVQFMVGLLALKAHPSVCGPNSNISLE
jgi:hypothetical protein